MGVSKQLGGCLAEHRMAKFGSKLCERNEDEETFRKARMRNMDSGLMNYFGFVEEYVEIDNSRAFCNLLDAAKPAFDRLQFIEQVSRR